LDNLDRSDVIKFAAGVGTVALIVGGWVAKKKLDSRVSENSRLSFGSGDRHDGADSNRSRSRWKIGYGWYAASFRVVKLPQKT